MYLLEENIMNRCIGCGIVLQNSDSSLDGYVSDINKKLCQRCFLIKNYGQIKTTNKSNSDYLKIISNIKNDDMVVYISNILTLNLDYIDKFNNIIVVITKRDVLPKSVKDIKIINYIKERYKNVHEVIVVSAYKKYNLDRLYNLLKKCSGNIYFVGVTNGGKSTLVNEMIKSYGLGLGNITTSVYPSTTLDIVSVKIGDLCIKDTPGILVSDSIINYLNPMDIKKINSKKEIKPITFQVKGRGVILVDDFFRIEYDTLESSMTFYMANSVNIEHVSLKNPKLLGDECSSYMISSNKDLVIEDVGFIKITNSISIKIYSKYSAYIYIRDNLI